MGIDTRRPHVHVVGIQSLRRQGHELEHLVDAHGTYDSIGGGDGLRGASCVRYESHEHDGTPRARRDDVLDDAHRLHVRHALDVELGRALRGDVEEPLHVLRRIGVDGSAVRLRPLDELRV